MLPQAVLRRAIGYRTGVPLPDCVTPTVIIRANRARARTVRRRTRIVRRRTVRPPGTNSRAITNVAVSEDGWIETVPGDKATRAFAIWKALLAARGPVRDRLPHVRFARPGLRGTCRKSDRPMRLAGRSQPPPPRNAEKGAAGAPFSMSTVSAFCRVQTMPALASGRTLGSSPVAARIALATAGPIGGVPGSPAPVGAAAEAITSTSIAGACSMRMGS